MKRSEIGFIQVESGKNTFLKIRTLNPPESRHLRQEFIVQFKSHDNIF